MVFGRDQSGKPHASWFDQASVALATKAAGLMNMHAVPVADEALRELAGSLPRGRVFASGKAFTPFIKGKLYDRLIELTREVLGLKASEAVNGNSTVEIVTGSADQSTGKQVKAPLGEAVDAPTEPAPEVANKATVATAATPPKLPARGTPRPSAADQVGMGSLVLAQDTANGGWFEATVIGVNGGTLTLKWRDYNEPNVVRRPTELGFLPALNA